MRGIRKLTMYSREVSFVNESQLDLRAPDLSQVPPNLAAGENGDDGKHGVDGPIGRLVFRTKMETTHKESNLTEKNIINKTE